LNPRAIAKWEESQEPYAQNFYENSSYGKLHLNFVSSHKVYQVPKSADVYNMTMPMPPTPALFVDAMEAAKADYDFSKVDEVLVVVPDEAIFDGGVSFAVGATVGGSKIRFGTVAQFANVDSNGNPYEPGWLAHEFGETIGLTEPEILPWTGVPSAWDVMSWNSNYDQDLYTWEKLILGWISPNQMACLDSTSLKPVDVFLSANEISSSDTKLAVVRLSSSQAIVVESRRNSGLDPLTAEQEGVLAYKVDLNKGWRQGTITDLYSNPTQVCGSFGCQLLGTLHQGETLVSEGVKIKVTKYTENGDFVSVERNS
jgi:M6 family metalloprotease-like protein